MKKELYEGHREDWSITGFLVYLMFIQAKNDRAKKVEKHNIIHRQPFFATVAQWRFYSSLL